jgi:hypothetical protein
LLSGQTEPCVGGTGGIVCPAASDGLTYRVAAMAIAATRWNLLRIGPPKNQAELNIKTHV